MSGSLKRLYPEIEPFDSFRLQVSPLHEIYVEQAGNPKGKPALFLHGGPGTGISNKHRRYFNPDVYRIILFDQRGAGRSTPHAEIRENTTWDLVSDIELIRKRLSIDKWLVFGGSWGSTLALAYSQKHPEAVSELVLRGIFLCRNYELQWFYQSGADKIFPDAWEKYLSPIPHSQRDDLISAYYRLLTSTDAAVRLNAAKMWSGWEGSTIKLIPDAEVISNFEDEFNALSIARIECHYFLNKGFFSTDNFLIENMDRIRAIPARVIHGRYDVVCPVKNAWELHRAWPESQLEIIADAGHAADEPGITDALIRATDEFGGLN